MPDLKAVAGNPVFTYKAKFRTTAQSVQRILFYAGALLITLGIATRFITLKNHRANVTLRYAPLLGLALILGSAVWALWWRRKLRSDFQKNCS